MKTINLPTNREEYPELVRDLLQYGPVACDIIRVVCAYVRRVGLEEKDVEGILKLSLMSWVATSPDGFTEGETPNFMAPNTSKLSN